MLLVYKKDLAQHVLFAHTQVLAVMKQYSSAGTWLHINEKACFMLTALQLQTSEQKPLQDPISNPFTFIYNFTFHALSLGSSGRTCKNHQWKYSKLATRNWWLSAGVRRPELCTKRQTLDLPSVEVGWKFNVSP